MKSVLLSLFFIISLFTSYVVCAVDYNSEIQPIFNANCIGCHGGSGGFSLASWNDVIEGTSNNGPIVIAGDTLNSKLLEKLMPSPSFGDRMPQSDPTYFTNNPNELQLIKNWILEGALETPLSIISKSSLFPNEPSIIQNFPNPFNPITSISYGLPASTNVQIVVYDISGKQIQSLLNNFQPKGYHFIYWDASSYPSGMYFAIMKAGEYVSTKKLMLIK